MKAAAGSIPPAPPNTDERYICTYCRNVLVDVVQAVSCGHRYCQVCWNELIIQRESCVAREGKENCGDDLLTGCRPDRALRKEIDADKSLQRHVSQITQSEKWKLRTLQAPDTQCKKILIQRQQEQRELLALKLTAEDTPNRQNRTNPAPLITPARKIITKPENKPSGTEETSDIYLSPNELVDALWDMNLPRKPSRTVEPPSACHGEKLGGTSKSLTAEELRQKRAHLLDNLPKPAQQTDSQTTVPDNKTNKPQAKESSRIKTVSSVPDPVTVAISHDLQKTDGTQRKKSSLSKKVLAVKMRAASPDSNKPVCLAPPKQRLPVNTIIQPPAIKKPDLVTTPVQCPEHDREIFDAIFATEQQAAQKETGSQIANTLAFIPLKQQLFRPTASQYYDIPTPVSCTPMNREQFLVQHFQNKLNGREISDLMALVTSLGAVPLTKSSKELEQKLLPFPKVLQYQLTDDISLASDIEHSLNQLSEDDNTGVCLTDSTAFSQIMAAIRIYMLLILHKGSSSFSADVILYSHVGIAPVSCSLQTKTHSVLASRLKTLIKAFFHYKGINHFFLQGLNEHLIDHIQQQLAGEVQATSKSSPFSVPGGLLRMLENDESLLGPEKKTETPRFDTLSPAISFTFTDMCQAETATDRKSPHAYFCFFKTCHDSYKQHLGNLRKHTVFWHQSNQSEPTSSTEVCHVVKMESYLNTKPVVFVYKTINAPDFLSPDKTMGYGNQVFLYQTGENHSYMSHSGFLLWLETIWKVLQVKIYSESWYVMH